MIPTLAQPAPRGGLALPPRYLSFDFCPLRNPQTMPFSALNTLLAVLAVALRRLGNRRHGVELVGAGADAAIGGSKREQMNTVAANGLHSITAPASAATPRGRNVIPPRGSHHRPPRTSPFYRSNKHFPGCN